MNETGIIKISRFVALFSFLLGTLILFVFYYSENSIFLIIGLIYVVASVIINGVFLIGLFLKLTYKEVNKKQGLISVFLILLNIPIVIIYYNYVMKIMSTIID